MKKRILLAMEEIYEVLFHICSWMVAVQVDWHGKASGVCEFLSHLSASHISVMFRDTYQSFQDFVMNMMQSKIVLVEGGFNIKLL